MAQRLAAILGNPVLQLNYVQIVEAFDRNKAFWMAIDQFHCHLCMEYCVFD